MLLTENIWPQNPGSKELQELGGEKNERKKSFK